MNLALVIQALGIILSLAQGVTTNAQAKQIITYAGNILPLLIQEAPDMVASVKQMLAILKGSSVMTAEDIAAVDALIAQADAAFDDAAADFNKRAHPNG